MHTDGEGVELLVSPARRRIMDLLVERRRQLRASTGARDWDEATAGITAADLGAELDLHVTTVRFHLDQMVAAGLLGVRDLHSGSAGRPRKVYLVRQGSLADDDTSDSVRAHAFEVLAGLLARSWLQPDGQLLSPEEAGRAWSLAKVPDEERPAAPAATPGQWLDRLGRTIDLLAEWGYTANISTREAGRTTSVQLIDCPFLELARDRADVVCGVHRGLLIGAMQAYGEPEPQVSLQPFVTERACLAHLTRPPFPQPTPAT